jgi:hypothetical protein
LDRERRFDDEMAKAPGWQSWLARNGRTLVRVLLAIMLGFMVLLIGWQFIFPSAPAAPQKTGGPVQGGSSAQATAGPLSTSTPTVTPLPFGSSPGINYAPIGALRILNVEFPTARPVVSGTVLTTPPPGAVFAAVQYEFTCGTGQAFCENPPQARLGLQLADLGIGTLPYTGLTLGGSIPTGRIASGSSISAWLVFAVPANQAPRRLVIGLDTNNDNQIDRTEFLELPR